MSDAQTMWKLGLAFGCAWGAWVMKCSSGVGDDSKADRISNGLDGSRSSHRLCRNAGMDEDHAMKGNNGAAYRTEPGSNVVTVDFAHCRAVRDLRNRLHELGVFSGTPDSEVKR